MKRAATLLNELGVGVAFSDDGIRTRGVVRTLFANPDDVVKRVLAISSADLGSARGVEIGNAIAAANPGSPFADDVRVGIIGQMIPVGVVGLLAAAAIPVFESYMRTGRSFDLGE